MKEDNHMGVNTQLPSQEGPQLNADSWSTPDYHNRTSKKCSGKSISIPTEQGESNQRVPHQMITKLAEKLAEEFLCFAETLEQQTV